MDQTVARRIATARTYLSDVRAGRVSHADEGPEAVILSLSGYLGDMIDMLDGLCLEDPPSGSEQARRRDVLLAAWVVDWASWTEGCILESYAITQGPKGHRPAIEAHRQGLKTRSTRIRIIIACVEASRGNQRHHGQLRTACANARLPVMAIQREHRFILSTHPVAGRARQHARGTPVRRMDHPRGSVR
jgi:hypothetical protein